MYDFVRLAHALQIVESHPMGDLHIGLDTVRINSGTDRFNLCPSSFLIGEQRVKPLILRRDVGPQP
ncbi:hypothetical protein D3C84_1287360 [compost metagenome]